jgi:hypothetical protein
MCAIWLNMWKTRTFLWNYSAMPKSNYPDYFFPCPKCLHKILLRVGTGKVATTPEESLFSVDCENCEWSGDLPYYEASPLPM